MKTINKNSWQAIIEGANLFGTGGGGTIRGAKEILEKISKPVMLISLDELSNNQLICAVFGVGGKQNCDPIISSRLAMQKFQQITQKKISTIVPVENGPMAIANAMFIASELGLPVLDSDIVGMRSSPEVYLETISIPNLRRTPCVISDGKNTKAILKNFSLEQLEKVFRDFAVTSGGDAIVAGYPLLVKDVIDILPTRSITEAEKSGVFLNKVRQGKIKFETFCNNTQWEIIGKGGITNVEKDNTKGFSEGSYKIVSKKDTFTVFFKNENLVVLKGKKIVLTCPDSISLINTTSWQALNNFNRNTNQQIIILGRKAIPIWRKEKGKNLFAPRNLGLPYKQVLLE